MDFGQALWCVKDGKKIRREGWPEGQFVIYVNTPSRLERHIGPTLTEVDWQPSLEDMIVAEDWQVVE